MLLFYEGFIVLVSHPDTNPADQGLTSVNFSITKLSDAQRAHLWWKEVVRELENYQHVSPEANVSRFYFNTTQFSAFWFSVTRATGNPVYASRKHLVEKTSVLIFINMHNRPLKEATVVCYPVTFHLAMEPYRDIHWCKVVYFITLLQCVWDACDFIFS